MSKPLKGDPSKHTLYMREWRSRHPEHAEYQRRKNAEYAASPEFASARLKGANPGFTLAQPC